MVLKARDALDRAHGIDRESRVAHDAAPRLHEEVRHRQAQLCRAAFDMRRQRRDACGDIDLLVRVHIAHAVASAEIQGARGIAKAVAQLPHKAQHEIGGVLIDHLVKDHGPDMAVQTVQLDMRSVQGCPDKFQGLAGADGDAELHIHTPGVHRLVGVRVDARRDAQQDLLLYSALAGFGVQGLQLLHAVHDEAAHALLQAVPDVLIRLAAAVEPDPLCRKARRERGMDLPAGNGVHAHPLFGHDAVHVLEGTGFTRVQRQGRTAEGGLKGVFVHTAVCADARLIHQVEGCAPALCEGGDALPRKAQGAVFIACDICTEHGLHLLP